ncbi:hypothetical protein [Roseibium sp. SCP14]|uniref:hypothetical protein n=1 Tax=Roseibium sp. SCP14 TaxID=3141375 RepID=UPI0033395170
MKSVWLTVDDKTRAMFREQVGKLAETARMPVFEPHITVVGDVDAELDVIVGNCEEVFCTPLNSAASVSGADGLDDPFMSLFLDVQLAQSVLERRDELYSRLMGSEPSTFRPHISLAYHFESQENRRSVVDTMAELFTGHAFGVARIEIWEADKVTPIERWQRLWSRTINEYKP